MAASGIPLRSALAREAEATLRGEEACAECVVWRGDQLGRRALLDEVTEVLGRAELPMDDNKRFAVMAQLGRVNGGAFSKSERRFMAHIVRKIEYVIEQSSDAMTGLMNRAGFEAQLQE